MRIGTSGLLAASLLALAAATPATAETIHKTLEQVVGDLSAKGYAIREIEMDDSHFEATVIDRKNVVSEARIDGVTGEILRLERKH